MAKRAEIIRSIWKDARDEVASIIDQADGRRTRHLKFDFRKYSEVARTLHANGLMSARSKVAVEEMDRHFNTMKFNWNSVKDQDVDEFRRQLAELKNGTA